MCCALFLIILFCKMQTLNIIILFQTVCLASLRSYVVSWCAHMSNLMQQPMQQQKLKQKQNNFISLSEKNFNLKVSAQPIFIALNKREKITCIVFGLLLEAMYKFLQDLFSGSRHRLIIRSPCDLHLEIFVEINTTLN